MEYYWVLKRNELSCHEKAYIGMKCILVSEISQYEKPIFCVITTILEKAKTLLRFTSVFIWGWGVKRDE